VLHNKENFCPELGVERKFSPGGEKLHSAKHYYQHLNCTPDVFDGISKLHTVTYILKYQYQYQYPSSLKLPSKSCP